ncbi:hypothetical protein [Salipiger mucosus]|uniref:Uncharacterized protein n=1 Tax=Salipiger mucosus DSM 16094 TaxID=1123237 RepID=S9Q9M3_9RHOB|nr:hypothetical protein [Salipiger mucosus]EPX76677.1 hypothetical protein Salmuc_00509 [Salipiger mucosus DSM 16094]
MELLLGIGIVLLAVGGLCAGLLLTGRPPRTACDGIACVGGGRCDACPKRAAARERSDD